MPELAFVIRWPDGAEQRCYSPSTVLAEHLSAGAVYSLDDFLVRARTALTRASDRVEARYGYRCSQAEGQLAAIETRAAEYAQTPECKVACISLGPLSSALDQGPSR